MAGAAPMHRRFWRACRWSFGGHLLAVSAGLLWGSFAPPIPPPEAIAVDILAEIPKGTSDEIGLGTFKEEPAVAPPQPEPPPSTPPPPEIPPTPVVEHPSVQPEPVVPRNTLPEPEKTKPPVVEKKPLEKKPVVATTKPATPQTSTPRAPAQQSGLSSLINTLQKNPIQRQGNPGERDSAGWKLGNTTAPIKEIPTGAVLNQYRAQAKARIRGQWNVPAQLKALPPKARPSATVHVSVAVSGAITNVSWVRKSGDSLMDDSVMRAVKRAAAPPIPEAIREQVLSQGLTLEFKP